MNLIIFDPNPALLVSLKGSLRAKAIKNRKHYSAKILQIREVAMKVMEKHHATLDKITRINNRARAKQKGIPSTEAMDALQPEDTLNNVLTDGEKFLLKKSYRQAASFCHPDRGGNKEDFQAVTAAYKSGDLGSLTEFVLTFTGELKDQLRYWSAEVKKPEIEWRTFRASPENKIAQLYMQGHHEIASDLTENLLDQMLAQAMADELLST